MLSVPSLSKFADHHKSTAPAHGSHHPCDSYRSCNSHRSCTRLLRTTHTTSDSPLYGVLSLPSGGFAASPLHGVLSLPPGGFAASPLHGVLSLPSGMICGTLQGMKWAGCCAVIFWELGLRFELINRPFQPTPHGIQAFLKFSVLQSEHS